jgi:hypothetical protein
VTRQVGRAFPDRDRSWQQSIAAGSIAGFSRLACQITVSIPGWEKAGKRLETPFSTHLPSNILRSGTPSAATGSWGRAVFRTPDTPNTGSMPSPDGHSFPPPQKLSRSCREPETCGSVHSSSRQGRTLGAASHFFQRCERTLLSLIRLQNFLPQPQRLRRNFHKLVVRDELNRLFQV